jgi:hypothetical protein
MRGYTTVLNAAELRKYEMEHQYEMKQEGVVMYRWSIDEKYSYII